MSSLYSYVITAGQKDGKHYFTVMLCEEGTENIVPNTEPVNYGPFANADDTIRHSIELTDSMSKCDQAEVLAFFKDPKGFLKLNAEQTMH